MNVGTRYPESRTGWPQELEGRHVRKEKKGSEKAAQSVYGRLTSHERDTVQKMLELDARAPPGRCSAAMRRRC